MLRSFIKADTEIIESKHSGKYISNLNFDVNQITKMLADAFLSIFKDGLTLIGLLFVMFFQNWKLIFNSNYYDSTCIYHCKNFRKKNE